MCLFSVTLGLDQDLKLSPAALLVHTVREGSGPLRSDSQSIKPVQSAPRATGQKWGALRWQDTKSLGLDPRRGAHILSPRIKEGWGKQRVYR